MSPQQLRVDATGFLVEVDGASARIDASGSDVVVRTEHPLRLIAAMARGAPPTATGRSQRQLTRDVAELLNTLGLRVTFVRAGSEVLAMGCAVDSALGAVLGTRRVQLSGAARAGAYAVTAAAVAGGVATVFALVRRRR